MRDEAAAEKLAVLIRRLASSQARQLAISSSDMRVAGYSSGSEWYSDLDIFSGDT